MKIKRNESILNDCDAYDIWTENISAIIGRNNNPLISTNQYFNYFWNPKHFIPKNMSGTVIGAISGGFIGGISAGMALGSATTTALSIATEQKVNENTSNKFARRIVGHGFSLAAGATVGVISGIYGAGRGALLGITIFFFLPFFFVCFFLFFTLCICWFKCTQHICC